MNPTLVKPGLFRDRRDAGRLLAEKLAAYANRPDVLVLALPRGGVPVAYEVARRLGAPLDVFVVRKLGVPGHEELAMGAVATGGVRVLNDQLVEQLGIPDQMIDAVAARERQELARRERLYRGGRRPPDVRGRTVILVDDGLATGATMYAAIEALRKQNPGRIVVAVPTASPETCEEMKVKADHVICAITPDPFQAVGRWYQDFSQTSDYEGAEITKCLIAEKNFTAVAVEADWPDAYRLNRYVRGASDDVDAAEALADFRRFPTWMWRNTVMVEFIEWLRAHNDALPPGTEKVGFYGLDLYSLHASMKAVLRYLEKVDPEAAKR